MLHLADNAAKIWQVTPEDAGFVHAAQCMRDALRRLNDLQEQCAVGRILAKVGVDLEARVPERTQGAGGHPFQLGMLCQQHKDFQHRRRCLIERVAVYDIDQPVDFVEAFVDRLRRSDIRKQLGFDVLQQDRVELGYRFGGPVIALHQVFAGTPGVGSLEAECLRYRRLHVEYQPVFAALGVDVQPDADILESTLLLHQLARLRRRDQSARRELAPRIAQAGCFGDPKDDLQITQSARTFLAIGFEAVRSVFVFHMALAHLQSLGLEECLRVHRRTAAVLQKLKQFAIAANQACFQQAGLYRNVGRGFTQAFVDRAYAVADFQADIPQ